MSDTTETNTSFFFQLTPNRILDAVEDALDSKKTGIRATGRAFALNSLENRVYEIELDNNTNVVTKFYRPGRWSKEMILEEHRFVAELEANEVPVIAPLKLSNDSTLMEAEIDGSKLFFSVFPKVQGRLKDELSKSDLEIMGRLLGRLHNIGAKFKLNQRIALNVENLGDSSRTFLLKSPLLPEQFRPAFEKITRELLTTIRPLFQSILTKPIAIHGDCHLGNVLWIQDRPCFLDFDDMVSGPAVQDLWLTVRGRETIDKQNLEILIQSYESMRSFDRREMALIEPLRALRVIHYNAWIARRWEDPIFKKMFPVFGTQTFWQTEISDLYDQLDRITGF